MWDTRDGEVFTYRTAENALRQIDTTEANFVAEVLDSAEIPDDGSRDDYLSPHQESLKTSAEELRDEFADEELQDALEYLTATNEETEQRRERYPEGRVMDINQGEITLPPVVLVDLMDIMVGSSSYQSHQREKLEELRDRGEISTDEGIIYGRFSGEPGLMERTENEEGEEVYSWTGGRLEEAIFDSVGSEGDLEVYLDDNVFHVRGESNEGNKKVFA